MRSPLGKHSSALPDKQKCHQAKAKGANAAPQTVLLHATGALESSAQSTACQSKQPAISHQLCQQPQSDPVHSRSSRSVDQREGFNIVEQMSDEPWINSDWDSGAETPDGEMSREEKRMLLE